MKDDLELSLRDQAPLDQYLAQALRSASLLRQCSLQVLLGDDIVPLDQQLPQQRGRLFERNSLQAGSDSLRIVAIPSRVESGERQQRAQRYQQPPHGSGHQILGKYGTTQDHSSRNRDPES